jgi:hypothetical protein
MKTGQLEIGQTVEISNGWRGEYQRTYQGTITKIGKPNRWNGWIGVRLDDDSLSQVKAEDSCITGKSLVITVFAHQVIRIIS